VRVYQRCENADLRDYAIPQASITLYACRALRVECCNGGTDFSEECTSATGFRIDVPPGPPTHSTLPCCASFRARWARRATRIFVHHIPMVTLALKPVTSATSQAWTSRR